MATAVASPVHRLSVSRQFEALQEDQKLYAHYLSRAAWHGAKIVMRQVSPESRSIFDFIMSLYSACSGDWSRLASSCDVSANELTAFLDYASTFLSNIGNYYGSGDQKFVPEIGLDVLKKLASVSADTAVLLETLETSICAIQPSSLGWPGQSGHSSYYPGEEQTTSDDVSYVSEIMGRSSILPENTRVAKVKNHDGIIFNILQASIDRDSEPVELTSSDQRPSVRVLRGDHSVELEKICSLLTEALKYVSHARQKAILLNYIESFKTGSLEAYRDSQRDWVKDLSPAVENIFGFVEPYRDPAGVRAEFEAIVAVKDASETEVLKKLVEISPRLIRLLPWAHGATINDGKGSFEKSLFEPPDFTSIHALTYCSSIVFPGINLPNYNDIRETHGFKNVIISNRMSAEANENDSIQFIDAAEVETFKKHKFLAYYIWVVLHELLGHGTGKMMAEVSKDAFNFDVHDPPRDLLTRRPIESWYRLGQTWTGLFADLATTVDECRAELVGAYLIDNSDILALFGISDTSGITRMELVYNLYLQLGTDGLRALRNYNPNTGWGQAHSRAHFAIMQYLLLHGNQVLRIACNRSQSTLTVHVDKEKILTEGKPALGRMLLRLHMYRCTANVGDCRRFYEALSDPAHEHLEWRTIVMSKKRAGWRYVQGNTFCIDGKVAFKEYDATSEGIIQSWAERRL